MESAGDEAVDLLQRPVAAESELTGLEPVKKEAEDLVPECTLPAESDDHNKPSTGSPTLELNGSNSLSLETSKEEKVVTLNDKEESSQPLSLESSADLQSISNGTHQPLERNGKTEEENAITQNSPTAEPNEPPSSSSTSTTVQDLASDYQEVDPISSKSTSVSEIEDGQILSSEYSETDGSSGTLKRTSSALSDIAESSEAKKTNRKRRITFSAVTAYYFPRAQGFTCVPSQGGSTLGMALKHSHEEIFTLSEHANLQRRKHRRLLMQLRKRRKSRSCKIEQPPAPPPPPAVVVVEEEPVAGCSVENSEDAVKESDSDDSDSGQPASDLSDSDLDVDNYYFLQPVPTRQRRALLRESGVGKIETSEKDDCRQIRVSRESCGCSCQGYCDPESCACAQSGIQCQVDRLNFPCGCTRDACANPSGRIEFNPVRVRTHFIHTLMRLEMENAEQEAASVAAASTDNVDGGGSHLQHQQQQLMSMEELPPASIVSQDYLNWETPVQPIHHHHQQQQQQAIGYTLPDSLIGENGWFSHYSTVETGTGVASSDYCTPYATVNAATEVFSYDPIAAYEPLIYHSQADHVTVAAENGQQHYTVQELVDGAGTSSSSTVQCYNDGYSYQSVATDYSSIHHYHHQQTFEPNTFSSYHHHHQHVTASYAAPPVDLYGYGAVVGDPIAPSGVFAVDQTMSDSILLPVDPSASNLEPGSKVLGSQTESSSNSSSEEDGLSEMTTSSLATIVKETMVSV